MKRILSLLLFATACGTQPTPTVLPDEAAAPEVPRTLSPSLIGTGALTAGLDLPLGSIADEVAYDGTWGSALTCKPVPSLPSLVKPKITLSVNGLTLHLVDAATGYDKVFPVGVGEIEEDETSPNFGESKSYQPLLGGKQDFAITPSSIQPCKTWWTDPDSGAKMPVFAGLPFMSWNGPYAVHGPIDNYRAANGGNLRRGFVSHGCFRMEAADVLEVYARIRSVASTPVHVQREPERLTDGRRVDLAAKWIGAECSASADCNYTGGFCAHNAYSNRGYCSARCTSGCADRSGQPGTLCVADPANPSLGQCVPRAIEQNHECRNYDHFVPETVARFKQSTALVACVPGSPGWVGDRCLASSDCLNGTTCSDKGICTQSCSRFCADEPNSPSTFCADDAAVGKSCLRTCTPASNASECPADSACVPRHRVGDAARTANVCVPS